MQKAASIHSKEPIVKLGILQIGEQLHLCVLSIYISLIMNEIDNMPESWREVAVLKMLQGRPTKEVCAILDISEKACYSRVSRIRKYLEQLISNENWP